MVLLAGLQALLARMTGEDDVAVGTPIAGRNRLETEGLIGLFVNSLVLRNRLDGDPDVRTLLARAREVTLGAYAHQDLPFERLVEELRPERSLSHAPLFQVMLVLQNTPVSSPVASGLRLCPIAVDTGTAKFDLSLAVEPRGIEGLGGLKGALEYAVDLFDAATVARFGQRLGILFDALAATTDDVHLSTLPLLTAAEKKQLLEDWNDTAETYDFDPRRGLHGLVERHAVRSPGEVAAVFGGETLTYGDLDRRANQLAHHLHSLGVGLETRVGVCAERSLETVVGLLGVLKAGAVLVPLDPAYPAERLSYLFDDAGVAVLLTQRRLAAWLPPHSARTVFLEGEAWRDEPETPPAVEVAPESLAYLIYTSGSTGKPKGAMNTHVGIVNRVLWMLRAFPVLPADRELQKTPFGFDVVIAETFMPLAAGACLVVAEPDGHRDEAVLAAAIERHGVTIVQFVPSHLSVLLEQEGFAARCHSLRRVYVGGEEVTAELAARFAARLDVEFVNLYGPAEAAVDTTFHAVMAGEPGPVPIGRPLSNLRVHVLDRWGALAPAGVPGELCVGGVHVGRGYHNRPALTAERFVPDPFGGAVGERLYRSGDLVRQRLDGAIEFLGRIDLQVKVRGVRVELGEVEAVLASHPEVREAVVVARRENQDDVRLAAFVIAETGSAPAAADLRAWLRERLPEALVPATCELLAALPVTPNGKLDRAALTALAARPQSAGTPSAAPRDDLEQALAAIWQELLGISPMGLVGRDDSFFDLGGHSLLAMRVVSRVRHTLGVEIPVRALFEQPTLAGLADAVRAAGGGSAMPKPVPAMPRRERAAGERDLPLSFAQERLWFLHQLQPESPAYNVHAALRLQGRLDRAAFAAALTEIAARHETLRTTFVVGEENGEPVQRVAVAGRVELPVVDLRGLSFVTEGAAHPTALSPDPSPARPPHTHPERERGATTPTGTEEATEKNLVQSSPSPVRGGGWGDARERGLGGEGGWAEARRLATTEARRTFDLTQGPLVRAVLLHLAEDDHAALFTLHHIVSDGWSTALLIDELTALYAAFTAGLPSPLPPLPIQYGDFARWQREWLRGAVLDGELAWWRERLAGAPPALELPGDHPRPPRVSGRGGVRRLALAPDLAVEIVALGKREGTTLFMTLLAGFGALLRGLTGRDDLVIGTDVANRNLPDTERLIGFFINQLTLRLDLAERPSFRALLAQVRETSLAAYAHQEVPFERLVEELRPERDLSRQPVFQISFTLQNMPRRRLELPGLTLSQIPARAGSAQLDLAVEAREIASGIALQAEYSADLFDPPTVDRMLRSFAILLDGAVTAPELPVGELPLLGEAESHQILVEWNDSAVRFPDEGSFPSLFAAQAAATPDAVAAVCRGTALTYRDLERLSGAVAGRLARLAGLFEDAETVVPILAARGLDFLAGVAGILRAGGAYLPLDPAHPGERWARLMRDSRATVAVVEQRLLPDLAGHLEPLGDRAPRLLALEDLLAPPEPDAPAVLPIALDPASPAYVLYTSGSTGMPKGAMLTHRGLTNHLLTGLAGFGQSAADTVIQNAAQSFDVSVWQLLAPLVLGGRVHLVPDDVSRDPMPLIEEVDRAGATFLEVVPSLLRQVLEEIEEREERREPRPALTRLRLVMTGGETLPPELCVRWLRLYPAIPLLNAYGPTECTDDVSFHPVRRPPPPEEARIPIGRPVENVRFRVLDRDLRPCPIGVPGELSIGGAGLGRGYLHDPARTADAWRPDPLADSFAGHPGDRLYRTGDLVRLRADGALDFLGRIDHQVKIRGNRIELGEIEAALARQAEVREAVVLLDKTGGEARLVAFVAPSHAAPPGPLPLTPSPVRATTHPPRTGEGELDANLLASGGGAPLPLGVAGRGTRGGGNGGGGGRAEGADLALRLDPAALRRAVAAELPAPMVPAAFVILPALPLSPNGKVDRRALARLVPGRGEAPVNPSEAAAPRDAVEETLAGIWSGVLEIGAVGVHDDFFALGGHSLRATRVMSRVRKAFGVEVPLAALFAAPTVAGLAEIVRQQIDKDTATARPVRPVLRSMPRTARTARTGDLPLSFSQQRLWFFDQLSPRNPLYNIPGAWRLDGDLDTGALTASVREIVRRHESLRTTFPAAAGKPSQRIDPPSAADALRIPVADLGGLPVDVRPAEALRLAREHARFAFDLAAGPLLRMMLVRLDARDHRFLFNIHHIVSDGWSLGVFQDELTALYRGRLQGSPGTPSPLPPLAIQYADFAVWQRELLTGPVLDEQLGWWRSQLEGAREDLELPFDRPRPAAIRPHGSALPFGFPRELSDALRGLVQRTGGSLFMTLLAAYQALLYRYTGQEDLTVGTAVAGRNQLETEALIGFFVNTLVLRADLTGDPPFGDLSRRVRDTTLAAQAHQDLPFERIVEDLRPDRNLAWAPLFQTMFLFQNVPGKPVELPGVTLTPLNVDSGTAKLDILIAMWEEDREEDQDEDGRLLGGVEYNTDLFDRTTMERLAKHLEILTAGAVADPTARLSDLPLLSAEEQSQLLTEWNDSASGFTSELCLHQLVERHAERTPDAPAVFCGGDSLTYGELVTAARRLARHLRGYGVGPESRVGLCVERSLDMLVGMLGILEAGAAYVPLDPGYPAERLAAIVEDSQAPIVVIHRGLDHLLPAAGVRIIDLDAERTAITAQSGAPLDLAETDADPAYLAYTIFTSGSTGRPKGVQIRHRNVVQLVETAGRLLAPETEREPAVWTVFHSYAFDLSVWEMWTCLAHGGCLVVVPLDIAQDPTAFHDLLATRGVTVLHQTPSALRQLVRVWEEGVRDPADLRLRRIALGGEAFPGELAGTLKELLGPHPRPLSHLPPKPPPGEGRQAETGARGLAGLPSPGDGGGAGRGAGGEGALELWNLYGPTEITVWASAHRLRPEDSGRVTIPLGLPFPGARIHLLDPALHLVPVGVAGEICVGGYGPARGYANRPDLTAEKFVPDPLATEPGARIYRTGDLARRRPDGSVEYIGRVDHQVKIRGFRVELKEIEVSLAAQAAVRQAVALVLDNRLIAFVAGETGVAKPVPAEMRDGLRERLPAYMVPAAFVVLDAFPLSSNGKVDRRALARLAPADLTLPGDETAAPRTPVEEIIAGVWCEILGAERLGVHDSFFDLGGHSLLATQVVSRLREAFGVEVPLRTLFEAPTVAGLAARVEESLRGDGSRTGAAGPLRLRPAADGDSRPLSFAQEWMWLIDQLDPTASAFSVTFPIRLGGVLDVGALGRALTDVARRHEILRTTFPIVEGRPLQRISPTSGFDLEVVDLSALPVMDAEADRLAATALGRTLDLIHGPLVTAMLLRRDADDHTLLLTLHHILFDGWSAGILLREVAAFYQGSALPELPIQYGDFAVWQREWLQGAAEEPLLAWWREKLTPPPPHLDLPGAKREPVTTLRSARLPWSVEPETTAALHALARREGATLFMMLLAVWQTLLHRTTRQTDIAVGAPVAGRTRREVEDLIGYFVNPLVMRTELAGDPTFREAVGRARETALGAWAHQDLPFTRLVAALQPDRTAGRTPFFQVMLLLQNMPVTRIELPGLTMTSVDHDAPLATFDLTLVAVEEGGGLNGWLWYNRDLLDTAAVASLIDQLRILLAGAAADPDLRLAALPLLSETARRQLLEGRMPVSDLVAKPLVALTGDLLHTLFEARVEAEPDAVALLWNGEETTYDELNRSANRLARHLCSLGVGPEDRVGLCLGRSPRLVAAVLATLKAGAGYLPLDPHYPSERLAFLLADAGVKVLVSERSVAEHLPAEAGTMIWLADPADPTDIAAIAARSDENLGDVGATPASLAYVIYTSGSTGTPKGVMVPHGNVTRLFSATDDWFRFDERDTWTLFHSYAFDFSVWELWGALLHGGRLVIVPWEVSRSPEDFHALLVREKVTVLNQTPSAFGALMQVEMASPAPANRRDLALRSLRWVIFGGEALSLSSLAPWIERYGDPARNRPRLVNMYGITETTVHVTYRPISAADLEAGSVIGEPIPDLEIYVLDEGLEPAAVGVAGEMYVGGAGLARGYLGQPDLTADRFVPDPFAVAGEPGRRLYRTGDLARRTADGDLEYLGRSDAQVKIRGFRIEPGEIEAALIGHPGVADAVVVAREDVPGDRRLVAYLVPDPQRAQPVRNLLRLEREARLNGRPTFELPNGMLVAHQHEGVTLGIFKEIFQGEVYRRHGIVLPDGATVFDIGANMGLFTLWVGTTVPGARLFSFEPIPATAEVLALNAEIHGLDAKVYAAGIAEAERTETFTYYPFFSSTSGRFPDLAKDRADIKAHILNEQRVLDEQTAQGSGGNGSTFEEWRRERETVLDEWLDEHMKSEKVACRLTTISSVIQEHSLETIDLLKIDAERSELDALAGIADTDWPKIRQLVIEVHAAAIRDRVVEILTTRGFAVEVEQDVFLEGTELYNVYARTLAFPPLPVVGGAMGEGGQGGEVPTVWSSPSRLIDDVRHAAAGCLPEHMVPAAFVILEAFPLTAHGKVDRKALPAPQEAAKGAERPIVEPRTPVERELVDIWKELLRVDRVSIYDNFFELGGHSLLLTQLASRIRTTFQVEIPLRVLFDVANVVEMTEAIAERQIQQVDQDEMAAMLDELRGLSPEEIKALLEAEG